MASGDPCRFCKCWPCRCHGTWTVPAVTADELMDRARLKQENARLRAALESIDRVGLILLADWFDKHDDLKGHQGDREVQRDLRRWADNIAEALRGPE